MNRNCLFSIVFCLLLTGPSWGQNVDYEIVLEQVVHYEADCDDGPFSGDEEYTAKVWAFDDVDATQSDGSCRTINSSSSVVPVTYNATMRVRTNTSATSISIRFDAWEDDTGDRCTFDDDTFAEDDCRVDLTVGVPFTNFPRNVFTSHGPFGDSDAHTVEVSIYWTYSDVEQPALQTVIPDYGAGSIQIDWDAAENANEYRVERQVNSGGFSNIAQVTGTFYEDTEVSAGNTYTYRVVGLNPDKTSPASATLSLLFNPPPDIPSNVTSIQRVLDDEIEILWSAADNATGYMVFRNTTNDHTGEIQIGALVPGTNQFDDTVVTGAEYFYWVRAVGPGGTSDYSVVSSAILGDPIEALGPWQAVAPLGSLAYRSELVNGQESIDPPTDVDSIPVDLEGGESLSVLVTAFSGLKPTVRLLSPMGTPLATASATNPDESTILQLVALPVSGIYTVEVSDTSGSIGDYRCELFVNAGFEDESFGGPSNNTLVAAQDLESYFTAVAYSTGQAARVLGEPPTPPVIVNTQAIFTASFDSGPDGFTFESIANGLWHYSTGRSGDGLAGHTPPGSLYYGSGEGSTGGGDFDTGDRNAGTATSPAIALPVDNASTLTFNYLLDAESGAGFDRVQVQVATNGIFETVASKSGGQIPVSRTSWSQASVDLTAFTGSTVTIRFLFDTVDGTSNGGEGLYVDDIHIAGFTFAPATDGLDIYRFDLAPRQRASLRLSKRTPGDSPDGLELDLLGANGTLLAAPRAGVSGRDPFINQLAPATGGTYFVRVRAPVDYQLVVTRDLLLDVPGEVGSVHLTPGGQMLGHVAFDQDIFQLNLSSGDVAAVRTELPGDGSGSFTNQLTPRVAVLDSSLTNVVADETGSAPDGRNVDFMLAAPEAGRYLGVVLANANSGEYLIDVSGSSQTGTPFEVYATDPGNGAFIATPPVNQLLVAFNGTIQAGSLQASDLLIDGIAATSVVEELASAATFDFNGVGDGTHTVSIAAGSILRVDGTPIEPFTSTFVVDSTPPTILSGSIDDMEIFPSGDLSYELTFSEAIQANTLSSNDIDLVGVAAGSIAVESTSYNATTRVWTVDFENLPEDTYTLTVDGSSIRNLAGIVLDGEPLGPNPDLAPTGDGQPDGDYEITFSVEYGTTPYPAFEALPPLGSLVYDPPLEASISPAGDVDQFTVDLDAGQTLTVVVDPSPGLQPLVQVFDPANTPLIFAAGAGIGLDAATAPLPIPSPGIYRVTVSGNAGTSGEYEIELLLNAAAEFEAHDGANNDSSGTAQDLSPSTLTPGDGTVERMSVIGSLSAGAANTLANFESGLDGFTIDNSAGQGNGLWHRSTGRQSDPDPDHSPPHSLYFGSGEDDLGNGSYGNDQEGIITSPPISVDAGGAVLQFNSWLEAEEMSSGGTFDDATIELSVAGGPFVQVASTDSNDLSNAASWEREQVDLAAAAGTNATVRFRFETDGSVTGEGWYIDDVALLGPETDYYRLDVHAGDRLSMYLVRLDNGPLPALTLLGTNPAVVVAEATESDGWLVGTGIEPTASGTHYLRVAGIGTRYHLVVIKQAILDQGPNDLLAAEPAQLLSGQSDAVLGHVDPVSGDSDSFQAGPFGAGDAIVADTWTPGDEPLDFENQLDPQLQILDANQVVIGADANSAADGRNARLIYLVTQGGDYTVRISAEGPESGEYLLRLQRVPAEQDGDDDLLPDAWELANGLDPNDPGTGDPDNGPDGDLDGDGVSNRKELEDGTDPNDPLSAFRVLDVTRTGVGEAIVTVGTEANQSYSIEYADRLAGALFAWRPFVNPIEPIGTHQAGSGGPSSFGFMDDYTLGTSGENPEQDYRLYRVRRGGPPLDLALFYDPAFVDARDVGTPDRGEAFELKRELERNGAQVTTFTGITAAALSAALADTDALVIPEMENSSLLAASLHPDAINLLSNYLHTGGCLLLFGSEGSADENLANLLLGSTIGPQPSFNSGNPGSPFLYQPTPALGTAFDGGPFQLNPFEDVHPWDINTLPSTARSLYNDSSSVVVSTVFPGTGQIVFLGWDGYLFGQENQVQSSGWGSILNRSLRQLYDKPLTVGTYDMTAEEGVSGQDIPIFDAGHNPAIVTNPTELAELDILMVQNTSPSGHGAEYLASLPAIEQAVAAGLVLVIHDAYAANGAAILPGGGGITFNNAVSFDIDRLAPRTLLTEGSAGVLDDTSLDSGPTPILAAATPLSLPPDGLGLLSTADPAEVVTFAYPFGNGFVIYSSINLGCYLTGGCSSPFEFAGIYAPNVLDYAASLLQWRTEANDPETIWRRDWEQLPTDTEIDAGNLDGGPVSPVDVGHQDFEEVSGAIRTFDHAAVGGQDLISLTAEGTFEFVVNITSASYQPDTQYTLDYVIGTGASTNRVGNWSVTFGTGSGSSFAPLSLAEGGTISSSTGSLELGALENFQDPGNFQPAFVYEVGGRLLQQQIDPPDSVNGQRIAIRFEVTQSESFAGFSDMKLVAKQK